MFLYYYWTCSNLQLSLPQSQSKTRERRALYLHSGWRLNVLLENTDDKCKLGTMADKPAATNFFILTFLSTKWPQVRNSLLKQIRTIKFTKEVVEMKMSDDACQNTWGHFHFHIFEHTEDEISHNRTECLQQLLPRLFWDTVELYAAEVDHRADKTINI